MMGVQDDAEALASQLSPHLQRIDRIQSGNAAEAGEVAAAEQQIAAAVAGLNEMVNDYPWLARVPAVSSVLDHTIYQFVVERAELPRTLQHARAPSPQRGVATNTQTQAAVVVEPGAAYEQVAEYIAPFTDGTVFTVYVLPLQATRDFIQEGDWSIWGYNCVMPRPRTWKSVLNGVSPEQGEEVFLACDYLNQDAPHTVWERGTRLVEADFEIPERYLMPKSAVLSCIPTVMREAGQLYIMPNSDLVGRYEPHRPVETGWNNGATTRIVPISAIVTPPFNFEELWMTTQTEALEGRQVSITGRLSNGTQAEYSAFIERQAGIPQEDVGWNTDILVMGSRPSDAQANIARRRGVRVMNEDEFLHYIWELWRGVE